MTTKEFCDFIKLIKTTNLKVSERTEIMKSLMAKHEELKRENCKQIQK
jgi:hypothetical protein